MRDEPTELNKTRYLLAQVLATHSIDHGLWCPYCGVNWYNPHSAACPISEARALVAEVVVPNPWAPEGATPDSTPTEGQA